MLNNALKLKRTLAIITTVAILMFAWTSVSAASALVPESLPAIDSLPDVNDPELDAMMRATEDAIAQSDFARFQELTIGTVVEGQIDEATFAQMAAAHREMPPMPPEPSDEALMPPIFDDMTVVNDEVVKLMDEGRYDEAQKLVETKLFPLPQE